MSTTPDALDRQKLRSALGGFVTGITVVTTIADDGNPRGFTANSFTSVSLDPPLILVCIGGHASSYPVFASCSAFAVNVLSEEQEQVSAVFASKDPDKFSKVDWQNRTTGAPVIQDALSWFDCDVEERIEAGDHMILIGRVRDFDTNHHQPLGYFKGNYIRFGLEEQVMDHRDADRVRFGAILEDGEQVLLQKDGKGGFTIPLTALSKSGPSSPLVLRRMFEDKGISISLGFLYSVFGNTEGEVLHVIYRGDLEGADNLGSDSGFELFPLHEIPWEKLPQGPITNMLLRYMRERSEDRFGIYVESDDADKKGHVAVLESAPRSWDDVTKHSHS